MSDASAFSPDYLTARSRFRAAAHALDYSIEVLSIGQTGPVGEDLTIDAAHKALEGAEKIIVVSSGLHGVEGFFGSAVQSALLEEQLGGWSPRKGYGLLLLHALNPYGFAWRRRVNEDNVDLNRNFLIGSDPYKGSPPKYAELDPLLNPARAPRGVSVFKAKAIYNIARHGMPALKNAVAGGQYDYPKGLFFGGNKPSATLKLLERHLPLWVGDAKRVIHIDFHTGLGKSGTYKLLVNHPWGSPMEHELGHIFGHDVIEPWEPEKGVSYAIRGGIGTWCKALCPKTEYDVVTAEFGTVHVLQVIEALHRENRAHHYAEAGTPIYEQTKRNLVKAFAPATKGWRDEVVQKGMRVVQQAMEATFQPS
jgi:hypothetical protein